MVAVANVQDPGLKGICFKLLQSKGIGLEWSDAEVKEVLGESLTFYVSELPETEMLRPRELRVPAAATLKRGSKQIIHIRS